MRIEDFLDRFGNVTVCKDGWKARCPAHDDRDPSLSISVKGNKILLNCFAGCDKKSILNAVGLSFEDLYLDAPSLEDNVKHFANKSNKKINKNQKNINKGQKSSPPDCTIEQYAEAKKLPLDFLKKLGLSDIKLWGGRAIEIPYFDENRNKTATRYRIHLNKDEDRFRWEKSPELTLYGLWRLDKKNKAVILVEGESDCHTLWFSGFNTLGVPGATNWKEERDSKHFDCFERIYIVHEPDKGGEAVLSWLGKSRIRDRAFVLNLGRYNDPSDLYLADPEGFRDAFNTLIDCATPFTQIEGQEVQDDLFDFETAEKPFLDIAKFSGITRDFVELATRNSEADPAAVLFTFLTRFGVEVGRNPFFMVGDSKHHGQLAVVVVGESAKARKGTSGKPVSRLFSAFSQSNYIFAKTSPGPFSSGEGIIYAVRDPVKGWNKRKQEYEIIDPGVSDKRLFVLDEEFAGVLTNTRREGNNLSMVIRSAWDDGNFDPLTKNTKIAATNAHIGWVSHITKYELQAKLPECEGFNGFANRILWVFSQRQKLVPLPEPMPGEELSKIQSRLFSILDLCHKGEREITLNEEAREAWIDEYYQKLTEQNESGLLSVVLNRAETQVRRLALLFTLLDSKAQTNLNHLNQAMTAWKYCEDSVSYIFREQTGDSVSRKILQALREKGSLTKTDINNLFSRHIKKDRLQRAINGIVNAGLGEVETKQTEGRPVKILKVKNLCVKSEKSEKKFNEKEGRRLRSDETESLYKKKTNKINILDMQDKLDMKNYTPSCEQQETEKFTFMI